MSTLAATMDPDAVLDWSFDWTGWLAAGETISEHTVTGTRVTVGDVSIDGGKVTAWVSGGSSGSTATVACRVTTNQGRTDERTVRIFIAER